MRLIIAILLLAGAQLAQAADPVGRIFYTPEERARLDALRTQRAVATQVRNDPIPEYVTFNGIVRRSDGQATVWVNGESLSEAELRNKQTIIGRIGRNGQILVQTPQAAATSQVRLKVGQSAELLSGRVNELYATQPAEPASKSKPEAKPKADTDTPTQTPEPPDTKAGATPAPKEIPPELLEALRNAAVRNNPATPATTESPSPQRRP